MKPISRVGKIARHCNHDRAEPRNFAHATAPRGPAAWATRRHALPRYSTLRCWRVAHPTIVRRLDRNHMSIATICRVLAVIGSAGLAAAPAWSQVLDKVSFGTNWVAEAEHGGFYQALADGTYRRYGLDVTIVPGGPNVNNRILLPVGKLDFFMSANTMQSFDAVEHDIPTVTVAASFQKDPQVLIAHPGVTTL